MQKQSYKNWLGSGLFLCVFWPQALPLQAQVGGTCTGNPQPLLAQSPGYCEAGTNLDFTVSYATTSASATCSRFGTPYGSFNGNSTAQASLDIYDGAYVNSFSEFFGTVGFQTAGYAVSQTIFGSIPSFSSSEGDCTQAQGYVSDPDGLPEAYTSAFTQLFIYA